MGRGLSPLGIEVAVCHRNDIARTGEDVNPASWKTAPWLQKTQRRAITHDPACPLAGVNRVEEASALGFAVELHPKVSLHRRSGDVNASGIHNRKQESTKACHCANMLQNGSTTLGEISKAQRDKNTGPHSQVITEKVNLSEAWSRTTITRD